MVVHGRVRISRGDDVVGYLRAPGGAWGPVRKLSEPGGVVRMVEFFDRASGDQEFPGDFTGGGRYTDKWGEEQGCFSVASLCTAFNLAEEERVVRLLLEGKRLGVDASRAKYLVPIGSLFVTFDNCPFPLMFTMMQSALAAVVFTWEAPDGGSFRSNDGVGSLAHSALAISTMMRVIMTGSPHVRIHENHRPDTLERVRERLRYQHERLTRGQRLTDAYTALAFERTPVEVRQLGYGGGPRAATTARVVDPDEGDY